MLKGLLLCLCCWGVLLYADENAVKASQFGYDSVDATDCLQRALDSGASTVIVDKQAGDWIIRPIQLHGNLKFLLEDDVVIRAKQDEFHDRFDVLIRVMDVDNVTIEGGRNSVITMPKTDYLDASRYIFSEWRHAIRITGSSNVTVRNLCIDGSGGDGIALNRGRVRSENRNILLENLVLVNHHRLAMGIVTVNGLTVRNCKFMDTSGTPPHGGMDFECNNPDEVITNIYLKDCLFAGNAAAGLMFIQGNCNRDTPPLNAIVENCVFTENGIGSLRMDCAPGQQGEVVFRNCRFSTGKGEGITINNAQDDGVHIVFENCTMDASSCKGSPILFSANRQIKEPFGNVDFGDMVVKMKEDAPMIALSSLDGPGLGASLKGDRVRLKDSLGAYRAFDMGAFVSAHPGNPRLLEFDVIPYLTKEYRLQKETKGVTSGKSLQYRGTCRFAQWIPAEQEIAVHFQLIPFSSHELVAEVELMDANGGLSDRFTIAGTDVYDYTLPAGVERGVQFLIRAGANALKVWSDGGGQGFPTEHPVSLCVTDSEFYFWVLADQTEVRVEVNGEEPLCAAILDADGNQVAEESQRFQGRKILCATRKPTATDELWKVKCTNVVEDYSLRIGAPSYPILFTAPSNAVIRR